MKNEKETSAKQLDHIVMYDDYDIDEEKERFAYYYKEVYSYADFETLTKHELDNIGGRAAGILSRLFQRHGLEELSYHHFQEVLDLTDNWLRDGRRDNDRIASLNRCFKVVAPVVNKLIDSCQDAGIAKVDKDNDGVPVILQAHAYVTEMINMLVDMNDHGYHDQKFRDGFRKMLDKEIKDVPRKKFDGNPFILRDILNPGGGQ